MKINFNCVKEAANVFAIGEGCHQGRKTVRDSIVLKVLQNNVKIVCNYNIASIKLKKTNIDYINFIIHVLENKLKMLKVKAFKRLNHFNLDRNQKIREVSS